MNYPIAIYAIICAFIILDIASGLMQALYNRTLDSKILRKGMFHKASYFLIVVLALALEYACTYLDLGFEIKVFIPLAVYIVLTESVSILENITKLNPELTNSPVFKLLSSARNRRDGDA